MQYIQQVFKKLCIIHDKLFFTIHIKLVFADQHDGNHEGWYMKNYMLNSYQVLKNKYVFSTVF